MKIETIILMVLMIAAAIAAVFFTPTYKIALDRNDFILGDEIPQSFNDWNIVNDEFRPIVNPQQEAEINRIYSQTLSRVYENAQGERIMLVIAYGEDQSDSNQLHYPEVCYPAQGFQIISKSLGGVSTVFGNIRLTKLVAKLSNRIEPVTYWTVVGNKVVRGKRELKLEQLRYGFKGKIPDGFLFRVSTIVRDQSESEIAYMIQEKFIKDMISALVDKNAIVFGE